MPTTSEGSKKRRQASSAVRSPVSAHIPCAIISRTTSGSATLLSASTDRADFTDTTRPGYGPGMAGKAAGGETAPSREPGPLPSPAGGGEGSRGQQPQESPAIHPSQ